MSPCRKPTMTSSPTSGRNTEPRFCPAISVTRLAQSLLTLSSSGNFTWTRPSRSGSSKEVTTPASRPLRVDVVSVIALPSSVVAPAVELRHVAGVVQGVRGAGDEVVSVEPAAQAVDAQAAAGAQVRQP